MSQETKTFDIGVLIATCKQLANEAGKMIREIFGEYNGKIDFEDKRTPEEIEAYIQRKIEEEKRKDKEQDGKEPDPTLESLLDNNDRTEMTPDPTITTSGKITAPPTPTGALSSTHKSEFFERKQSTDGLPLISIHRKKPSLKDISMSPKLVHQTSLRSLDPRTIADVTANAWIVENLAFHFPKLIIKSEEGDGKTKAREELSTDTDHILNEPISELSDYRGELISLEKFPKTISEEDLVVWVDPLDGTKALIKGETKAVTVLIGIADNRSGECLAGVVHRPFMDITVLGISNCGVYTYGYERLNYNSAIAAGVAASGSRSGSSSTRSSRSSFSFSNTSSMGMGGFGFGGLAGLGVDEQKYLHMLSQEQLLQSIAKRKNAETNTWPRKVCTTGVHVFDELKIYLNACHIDSLVNAGGAGNKGLLVLENDCDAFVFPQFGTKKWDTCAVNAIYNALPGGCFTDCKGVPLSYNSTVNVNNDTGFVATVYGEEYHKTFLFPDLILQQKKFFQITT